MPAAGKPGSPNLAPLAPYILLPQSVSHPPCDTPTFPEESARKWALSSQGSSETETRDGEERQKEIKKKRERPRMNSSFKERRGGGGKKKEKFPQCPIVPTRARNV